MIQIDAGPLLLRELTPDDVSRQYVAWLNDPAINRYLEVRHQPQSVASTREFVQAISRRDDDFLFGMFLNQNEHIGNIRLGPVDQRYRRALIGLLIGDSNHHGRGFATHAIAGLCRWAFSELKLHKLEAGCYSSNQGSKRAFEKVGFQVEGRLREHWLVEGAPEDHLSLGLLASEFEL